MDERIREQVEGLVQFPESGRVGRVDGTRELVINRTPYNRGLSYRWRDSADFACVARSATVAWGYARGTTGGIMSYLGHLRKASLGMTRDGLARVLSWIFWTALVSFFGFFLGAKGSATEHGELVGAFAGAVLGFAIGWAFRRHEVR